jgi:ubiquinone/menaquinone biosynthesis C-methylase UbiE
MAEELYETPGVAELPFDVTGISLGCGDPVTLAGLQPGETVLDLGSGGGIDCFLAARQVGPGGHVIGVDMTADMLEKARANASTMGVENVEFRLGEIEHLPVANESVDVVISNCVINLSPDKPQVFHEAYRVLQPGGRLAVSDIVTRVELPPEVRQDLNSWAACVAGAWVDKDYVAAIEAAGFVDVRIQERAFDDSTVADAAADFGIDPATAQRVAYSASVTARKPR